MTCGVCRQHITFCFCDDIDERIADLEKSPYLAIDWNEIRLMRLFNKDEIQRLKEKHAKVTKPTAIADDNQMGNTPS